MLDVRLCGHCNCAWSFAVCSLTYLVFIYAEIYFHASLSLAAEKVSSLPVILPAFTSHCLLLALWIHSPVPHYISVGIRVEKTHLFLSLDTDKEFPLWFLLILLVNGETC